MVSTELGRLVPFSQVAKACPHPLLCKGLESVPKVSEAAATSPQRQGGSPARGAVGRLCDQESGGRIIDMVSHRHLYVAL